MCISYPATLKLLEELSHTHSAPLIKWIVDNIIFKFWGDNVDLNRHVRDWRSDHQGGMIHMFSLIVGRSRTQAPELPHIGQVSSLDEVPSAFFLPNSSDVDQCKANLVKIVSRSLTYYISALIPFTKVVPKHILHTYSSEMAMKSDVFALDILMKNEAKHKDMIDIMNKYQDYLGKGYNEERRVLCGGDQLTCERQVGSQRHMMCGNSTVERLGLLEPVSEDWHSLVSFLGVSCKQ